MEQRRRFRELLRRPGPIVAPGVYDCLTAMLVEQAGFEAVNITGAGVVASVLGLPDVGLITMSEVLAQSKNITRSIKIPVVADCDTGYGNALNAMRTIQEFEAAGVAALFIEDQVAPKKCGHFEGKQLISRHEMVGKIKAAVAARSNPDLVIMARTDARAVYGLREALDRAQAYAEAGAEILFVEAPQTRDELAEIGRELAPLGVHLMANMVEGGKTPVLSVGELAEMGFKLVTFSGSVQRVAIKAIQDFLAYFREAGSVEEYFPSKMVTLGDRSKILDLPKYYELERRFLS
ncbi:MAG: isocitrate lyase/PEP mutase family protein [Chloroflexota bacterium]